jgi:hypothetical protein
MTANNNDNDSDDNKDRDNNNFIEAETSLKSTLKDSPFDFLIRRQYRYESPRSDRYILAYFESPNGISKAIWSLFDYGSDEDMQGEEHIDLSEDFDRMILSEDWDRIGSGW